MNQRILIIFLKLFFFNNLLAYADNLLDNKEMIINKPKSIHLFDQNKKNIPVPKNIEHQNQNINDYFDIIPKLEFYFPSYNLDFEYQCIKYDIDDLFRLKNNINIGGGYPKLIFISSNYTYDVNDKISIFSNVFEQSFSEKSFFGNNICHLKLGMEYNSDYLHNKSYVKYSNSNFENYLLEQNAKKHNLKFHSSFKLNYNSHKIKPYFKYKYFHYSKYNEHAIDVIFKYKKLINDHQKIGLGIKITPIMISLKSKKENDFITNLFADYRIIFSEFEIIPKLQLTFNKNNTFIDDKLVIYPGVNVVYKFSKTCDLYINLISYMYSRTFSKLYFPWVDEEILKYDEIFNLDIGSNMLLLDKISTTLGINIETHTNFHHFKNKKNTEDKDNKEYKCQIEYLNKVNVLREYLYLETFVLTNKIVSKLGLNVYQYLCNKNYTIYHYPTITLFHELIMEYKRLRSTIETNIKYGMKYYDYKNKQTKQLNTIVNLACNNDYRLTNHFSLFFNLDNILHFLYENKPHFKGITPPFKILLGIQYNI